MAAGIQQAQTSTSRAVSEKRSGVVWGMVWGGTELALIVATGRRAVTKSRPVTGSGRKKACTVAGLA
jgi:hypothetical protein